MCVAIRWWADGGNSQEGWVAGTEVVVCVLERDGIFLSSVLQQEGLELSEVTRT